MTVKKNRRLLQRESASSLILRWVLRVILYGWAVTIIFPLAWMLYSSLKTAREFMTDVWALPKTIYLVNYIKAWIQADLAKYSLNTITISVITVSVYFLLSTTTAYILAKYDFALRNFFKGFYFAAMMVPSILVLVPLYFQLESIRAGFTDNIFVLAVVYGVQVIPTDIYLMTGFIRSIDDSFIEAARIDGAGEWNIYRHVIIPFEKPTLLFLCLKVFMTVWNEYTMALTFLKSPKNYTISIGLQRMTSMFSYGNEHGAVFAGLVISMLPIMILYVLFQKQLLNGMDAGSGVK